MTNYGIFVKGVNIELELIIGQENALTNFLKKYGGRKNINTFIDPKIWNHDKDSKYILILRPNDYSFYKYTKIHIDSAPVNEITEEIYSGETDQTKTEFIYMDHIDMKYGYYLYST